MRLELHLQLQVSVLSLEVFDLLVQIVLRHPWVPTLQGTLQLQDLLGLLRLSQQHILVLEQMGQFLLVIDTYVVLHSDVPRVLASSSLLQEAVLRLQLLDHLLLLPDAIVALQVVVALYVVLRVGEVLLQSQVLVLQDLVLVLPRDDFLFALFKYLHEFLFVLHLDRSIELPLPVLFLLVVLLVHIHV